MQAEAGRDYEAELELAVALAEEAGELLRDALNVARHVEFKGATDLVTDADRASESLISGRIVSAFPDDVFLGEETGASSDDVRTGRVWVVDPLDGTTNYVHGFPIFCVSIGLLVDAEPVVGAVNAPMLGETFAAAKGRGATLNGDPIEVSATADLRDAMVCTGFPYDIARRHLNIPAWARFNELTRAARRTGSAAYDMCCVASGRFDGYWERDLSAWDVAGGSIIVTEAGGALSDYRGESLDLFGGEIVAANPTIHQRMLEVLADLDDRLE